MASYFSYCPVIRECPVKENPIEKNVSPLTTELTYTLMYETVLFICQGCIGDASYIKGKSRKNTT